MEYSARDFTTKIAHRVGQVIAGLDYESAFAGLILGQGRHYIIYLARNFFDLCVRDISEREAQ